MIVYDLACENGHRFEGWFGSSDDFTSQREAGVLCCPACGSARVAKAPMAPAVGRKGNQRSTSPGPGAQSVAPEVPPIPARTPVANAPMPPEVEKALAKLAEAQARALKDSKWVGKDFAEQSRKMHYGETDHQAIHGEASAEEAKALIDEGVPVAPLPFPVAPPDKLN